MEPNNTVPPNHQEAVDTIAEMFHLTPEIAHTCLRNANYNKEVSLHIFRELLKDLSILISQKSTLIHVWLTILYRVEVPIESSILLRSRMSNLSLQ